MVLLGVGCAPANEGRPAGSFSRAPVAGPSAAQIPGPNSPPSPAAGTPNAGARPSGSVGFIHDDLPSALSRAKAENKALFVDAWAEWCHTCISMQNFVLNDPALLPLAERTVFLALDTERHESEKFLSRYSVSVWPTFFMIDPEGGRLLGSWQGAGSLGELRGFIEESLAVKDAIKSRTLDPNTPLALLVEARSAQASGQPQKAAVLFERAVSAAPPDWPRKSQALHGLIQSWFAARDAERCVKTGLSHLEELKGAALPVDFTNYLFECSKGVRDPKRRATIREAALARMRVLVEQPSPESSVDDRADALVKLSAMLLSNGDKEGARAAQARRLELMERAASAAPSPQAASTFDLGRARAYVALGRSGDAVRLLEQRTKELPESAEPLARLAELFVALKRLKDALATLEKALPHAEGSRKLSLLALKAEIQAALGDRAGQVRTLEQEIEGWQALGAGPAQRSKLDDAKKRLARARKPAGRP